MTRCRSARPEPSTLLAAGKVLVDIVGTCTLLGPEGPDALRSTDREQTNLRAFLGCPCGKRGRYRPYFENYTVDASIF